MDLSTITVTDFKVLFRRDFPFLPTYDATAIYNLNDRAYSAGLFWESKADGVTAITPAAGASWNKVVDNADDYIQDSDITQAFTEAASMLNQGLFNSDGMVKVGFLYLSAHLLANNIRTASNGVQSVGAQMVSSRAVGGVSEAYTIPQKYIDDPVLAAYTSTGYGMKYLALVLPALRGNFGAVFGDAQP